MEEEWWLNGGGVVAQWQEEWWLNGRRSGGSM